MRKALSPVGEKALAVESRQAPGLEDRGATGLARPGRLRLQSSLSPEPLPKRFGKSCGDRTVFSPG
jgi:hypothetical protein